MIDDSNAFAITCEEIVDQLLDERAHLHLGARQGLVAAVQALRFQQRDDDLLHLDQLGLDVLLLFVVVEEFDEQAHSRQRRAQFVADTEQQRAFCIEHVLDVCR